jgi:hypothetical protein
MLYHLIHSRMPSWVQPMIPRILYITEKGWNFYPYTKTGKINIQSLPILWYMLSANISSPGCAKEYTVSMVVILHYCYNNMCACLSLVFLPAQVPD